MTRTVRSSGAPTPGIVLWVTATIIWLLALLAERLLYKDSVSCELPGAESVYGEPGWSWFPLGHTCTWEAADGLHLVDSPSLMTMLPLVMLGLWGLSLLLCARAASRRDRRQSP